MIDRDIPPPPEGHVRVRMRVAYDGAPFYGFARNPDVRTVQGDLEEALAEVLRHPVEVACAGRTDTGVHARGQVVSFDADESRVNPAKLGRALTRMLGPGIAVDQVELAAPDFDARHSCIAREYRYHVLNTTTPDPLVHHLSWHVREPLDLLSMNAACLQILGRRDFTSFSKRNKSKPTETFVREVHAAEWTEVGPVLRFEVDASAFSRQMVRSLVGMLVDIGRGRREPGDMAAALEARSREGLATPAPPGGLILWRARYGS